MQVAAERRRLDALIAGLLFMVGMRRSEVSALRTDVIDSTDGEGILVAVCRSTTNQEGDVNDAGFVVKVGVAGAIRTLRATPHSGDRVVLLSAQMIGLRFTAPPVQLRSSVRLHGTSEEALSSHPSKLE